MTTDLMLKLTKLIPAAPERVFDAWLDPEQIAKFMITGPGTGIKSAETEAKVGGSYRIVMTNDMGEVPHWGTYREIERPSRLVFTWNSPHASPDSLVTLTFEPEGDGTLLTLTHDKFPSDESREGHNQGWSGILESLAGYFG